MYVLSCPGAGSISTGVVFAFNIWFDVNVFCSLSKEPTWFGGAKLIIDDMENFLVGDSIGSPGSLTCAPKTKSSAYGCAVGYDIILAMQ